ncbi:PREDICTED: HRAS-like suppressor 2 [Branchiostoma belcheri]|uniref:HRAS-like suppressor 2 n=1 Tax=Branchiostoma belcheri TaxID=7741 RepID=A0A6P4ZYY6_BRABE|nr:PREDICTED: HRAS-like suppressor 2 [Branchiostoma belcheri]
MSASVSQFRYGVSSEEVRRHNETVLADCEAGDLLEFPRSQAYSHWAVYIGDMRVIHLSGENDGISDGLGNPAKGASISGKMFEKAQIMEDLFWDVVGDSMVKKNNYQDGDRAVPSGREIVARARSRLGEEGYNVLFKNCEHFATWCRYGTEQSQQVNDALWYVGVGTAFAAGTALLAGWMLGDTQKEPRRTQKKQTSRR